MSLFLPPLAAFATSLAVEGKPVPDEAARQTAARVRASMLTGNWTWLHELDTETRNPILEGLGRWTLTSSTLEILALRLDILSAAFPRSSHVFYLVKGAGWGNHGKIQGLGPVKSWGKCPYPNGDSFENDDFWQVISDQVEEQEDGVWSGITDWSWDGDRGLLLVEREDIEPPRRFVITPMPKDLIAPLPKDW
jgi:hypothetical protein